MVKRLFLKLLDRYASKWIVLVIDIGIVCVSFIIAYLIRFNFSLNFDVEILWYQIPFIIIVSLISFLTVGTYKGIIRHTGTRDAFNVFVGVSLITLFTLFIVTINRITGLFSWFTIPKTIIAIHFLIANFLLIISRYLFKTLYEIVSIELDSIKTVLIYGAGNSGILTYNALNRDAKYNYEIAGFIDDDKNKVGKKIDRVVILGINQITKEFIKSKRVSEVIISIQEIDPARLIDITDYFLEHKIKVKIVPPLSKWIDGDLEAKQIKQIKIEDLLNRKPIKIDNPIVKQDVEGKVVLVTGAAGSIGSEISRQLSNYNLKQLILVDQAESALYELQQELIQKDIKNFEPIVADIRDKDRMEKIFTHFKPQKIFHAAAYKHVPLMEESPYEAVRVNVGGTKIVADLAIKHKAERFVMVSTDKAVNPTNVMGATKRVAEMYVCCLSRKDIETKFTTTRFGNVLGSNGSVIPLFKKQIENGGPLTVTHQDITRYFMTIPEACRLVLEAGTMGNGGEVYIFDMGKSVKIFDIAKRMIHLSGLNYPEDIDIKITGLRPGEKLYEELLADGENTIGTHHKKIMIAKTPNLDNNFITNQIELLCNENLKHQNKTTVINIKKIVPEYISNNSEFESLDKK